MITVEHPDGPVEAYLEVGPNAPAPGVLLFMDAIGLRPQIQSMAAQIASWGYTVLAPNVFFRFGSAQDTSPDGPLDTAEKREAFFTGVRPRLGTLTTERMSQDAAVFVAALVDRPEVSEGSIGVVGYCMGARFATIAAGDHPQLVAAAAGFHGGGIVTDDEDSPHLRIPTARAEFAYGHADNDRSMAPEAVEILGTTLSDAGLTAINEVYPGATHGYTMADTASYDEASAQRAMRTLRGLLDRTLG
ncbi:carboxymethylenebutenolidase [Branchiibius hedensis]|uniref:Carboxymethylenebutenolidase n=1 Tax=Branchiibius hedensis TaxID=672460 RepID=A0A2Y9A085_9MICO|nr:dienelactone hydrolase family protein [Branchiibius hedensis]PWJ26776.1 carboxymethylenebutenolidase [Branchiibius hedensis]SSA35587.1 carboxymethylenebutenolidase [Branchiibius hedensis]